MPVVQMPLARIPPGKKPSDEPALLEKTYRPNAEVAVEGKIEVVPAKDLQPFTMHIKFLVKHNNRWVIANSHGGGKPLKVKQGVYRYRSVIKTPQKTGIYYLEVIKKRDAIARTKIRVGKDVE